MHIICTSKCFSVTHCQQLRDTTQASPYTVQRYAKYITDTQQHFSVDALLYKLVNVVSGQKFVYSKRFERLHYPTVCELETSELDELLQTSAVEHMTTFRQLEARDFGSVATIVTTLFEAGYAYKCGDYRQCLQLSTQNVHTLLRADRMPDFLTFPVFVQLLDDDIVSLTALTLIVNPKCFDVDSRAFGITELTLSLYLMTQCQLKLRHPVTSLSQTLHCIKVAYRRHDVARTLDRLTLKMITQKAPRYLTT